MVSRSLLLALCLAGSPVAAGLDLPALAADSSSASSASLAARDVAAAAASAAEQAIKRFLQVDDRLYRGGQPDESGFKALRDLGVTTIVSLRTDDEGAGEQERAIVTGLGMRFVHIPIALRPFDLGSAFTPVSLGKFFEVVDDPANGKVFLHCRRGADRTGTLVSLYRVARQGWTIEKAYDEARDIGMRWWYFPVKGRLKELAATFPLATQAPAQTQPQQP